MIFERGSVADSSPHFSFLFPLVTLYVYTHRRKSPTGDARYQCMYRMCECSGEYLAHSVILIRVISGDDTHITDTASQYYCLCRPVSPRAAIDISRTGTHHSFLVVFRRCYIHDPATYSGYPVLATLRRSDTLRLPVRGPCFMVCP